MLGDIEPDGQGATAKAAGGLGWRVPMLPLERVRPTKAITVGAILLTLIAISLFILLAVEQRRDALDSAAERTAVLAAQLAEQAGRVLNSANLMLDQATALLDGRSWDSVAADESAHASLKRLSDRHGYIEALWLTDQDGVPRATSREYPAPKIASADRAYFQAHRAGVEGPLLSRMTLRPGHRSPEYRHVAPARRARRRVPRHDAGRALACLSL